MKRKSYIGLLLVSALMAFSSCKDEAWNQGFVKDDELGELNMEDLSLDVSEIEKVIKIETQSRSRDVSSSSYDVNSFIVRITNSSTGATVNEWTYSNTPEIVALAPDKYTVTVFSHDVQPAEWEKPYFHVQKDVTIVAGAVERLGVMTAKLANSAVSVVIDDELKKYCDDDVQIEVVANDEGRLVYTKDESRKGYFKIVDGSSTIVVTFSGTINGYKENVILPKADIEAGQHRIYTFRAKTNTNPVPDETGNVDPAGGIGIDVSVSEEDVDGEVTLEEDYEVVDPSDRPDYEAPEEDPGEGDDPNTPDNPDDPTEEAATFEPKNGTMSLENVNNYNDYGDDKKEAVLLIYCPEGFAHIYVDIDSPYLTDSFMSSINLSTHFDLAEPGSYEEGLKSFNFKTGDEVKGKSNVDFDITTLAPLLKLGEVDANPVPPESIHTFKITVVDIKGNSSACLLKFNGVGN